MIDTDTAQHVRPRERVDHDGALRFGPPSVQVPPVTDAATRRPGSPRRRRHPARAAIAATPHQTGGLEQRRRWARQPTGHRRNVELGDHGAQRAVAVARRPAQRQGACRPGRRGRSPGTTVTTARTPRSQARLASPLHALQPIDRSCGQGTACVVVAQLVEQQTVAGSGEGPTAARHGHRNRSAPAGLLDGEPSSQPRITHDDQVIGLSQGRQWPGRRGGPVRLGFAGHDPPQREADDRGVDPNPATLRTNPRYDLLAVAAVSAR